MEPKEKLFVAFPSTPGLLAGGRRAHVHVTDAVGKPLCGTKHPVSKTSVLADWEWLHSTFRSPLCEKCLKAAVLRLRPAATFWYQDPWNGSETHEFHSLGEAKKTASKEHCPGSIAIWQLGPGDTNKIVGFVEGLPPLP